MRGDTEHPFRSFAAAKEQLFDNFAAVYSKPSISCIDECRVVCSRSADPYYQYNDSKPIKHGTDLYSSGENMILDAYSLYYFCFIYTHIYFIILHILYF